MSIFSPLVDNIAVMQKIANLFTLIFVFLAVQTKSTAQIKLGKLDMDGDVLSWYDQALGKDKTGILEGKYEQVRRLSPHFHPFFMSDQWVYGSINHRNQHYDSVLMILDIEKEIVLIKHPTKFAYHDTPIKIDHEQLKSFRIYDHEFVNFTNGELTGIYDQIFAGENVNLFVRRHKYAETNAEFKYIYQNKYYLEYDGHFYKIKNQGALLRKLKIIKSDLRKHIVSNQMMVRMSPEYESNLKGVMNHADLLLSKP